MRKKRKRRNDQTEGQGRKRKAEEVEGGGRGSEGRREQKEKKSGNSIDLQGVSRGPRAKRRGVDWTTEKVPNGVSVIFALQTDGGVDIPP